MRRLGEEGGPVSGRKNGGAVKEQVETSSGIKAELGSQRHDGPDSRQRLLVNGPTRESGLPG